MPQYFGQLPINEQAWSSIGAVQTVKRDERGVLCECVGASVAIAILAPNLVRVKMSPIGDIFPRRSWAVTKVVGCVRP